MNSYLHFVLFFTGLILYLRTAGQKRCWRYMMMAGSLFYLLLNILYFGCNYFTGTGINRAAVHTLTDNLTGAGIDQYLLPAGGLAACMIFSIVLLGWLFRRATVQAGRKIFMVVAMLFILTAIALMPATTQLVDIASSQYRRTHSDFPQYLIKPAPRIDKPVYNLVYIYAESLERTLFDENKFPQLVPDLNNIRKSSLDFSDTRQLPGTDFTIGGIVASQCGIPFFSPMDRNFSDNLRSFFPSLVCLGDILKNSGYENYFYQGADLRFASKAAFFNTHGFQHVAGLQEQKPALADQTYLNDWGLYDDTTLNTVWEKYQTLAAQNKPFALFALTVDTHPPVGSIARSCQQKRWQDGKDEAFNAVLCSQENIATLINNIKASPGFKNTLIVVSSDHLAMEPIGGHIEQKQPQRENLFFILRGDRPRTEIIARPRNTMDNGATVLELLGGDNAIGLGRSTLSRPSLSATHVALETRLLDWEPDIIRLWSGDPQKIGQLIINQQKNSVSLAEFTYALPVLFKVTEESVQPYLPGTYNAPLSKYLAHFDAQDRFVWIDNCFRIARLGKPELATARQLCLAEGTLGSAVSVRKIPTPVYHARVAFPQHDDERVDFYQRVKNLNQTPDSVRYPADRIMFDIEGFPQQVKAVRGISWQEPWGRWSNANIEPAVTVVYKQPLPDAFDLTLVARASAANVGKNIIVRAGKETRTLVFGSEVSTQTVHFSATGKPKELIITPPDSEPVDEEGRGITLAETLQRRLGIGLVELKISPAQE